MIPGTKPGLRDSPGAVRAEGGQLSAGRLDESMTPADSTRHGGPFRDRHDGRGALHAGRSWRSRTSAPLRVRDGAVHAVNGVSFDLHEGELLGVVGESGSGKSVTMMSLLKLLPMPPAEIVSGRASLDGEDLISLDVEALRAACAASGWGSSSRDPMTSLTPVLTVGYQITEPLRVHLGMGRAAARERAVELLERVGNPAAAEPSRRFPAPSSRAGCAKRVMIAIALACNPKVLIADEPTTALDVTIQAQILDLVKRLRRESGMAIIWITHDLGVVAGLADRVMVMYGGLVVERAGVRRSTGARGILHPRPARHPAAARRGAGRTSGEHRRTAAASHPGARRLPVLPALPARRGTLPARESPLRRPPRGTRWPAGSTSTRERSVSLPIRESCAFVWAPVAACRFDVDAKALRSVSLPVRESAPSYGLPCVRRDGLSVRRRRESPRSVSLPVHEPGFVCLPMSSGPEWPASPPGRKRSVKPPPP